MSARPDDQNPDQRAVYQPPTIERLGTLAELTLGGSGGIDDGTIGAGDQQSLPF